MAAGAQDYLVRGKAVADIPHRTVRYAIHRSQTGRANAQAQAARQRAEEHARLNAVCSHSPSLTSPR